MLLGIADQALLAITNRALYDELRGSFLATVQALGNALDLKDSYTNDHAQALVGLCGEVAERMELTGSELRDISFAAALHDIGKIGIPAEILNKPGPLTDDEFTVMKRHPDWVAPDPGAGAVAGRCRRAGGGLPRALGRQRLSGRAGRRADPAGRPRDPGLRRLRRHDHRPRLPAGDDAADAIAELRRCSGGQLRPARGGRCWRPCWRRRRATATWPSRRPSPRPRRPSASAAIYHRPRRQRRRQGRGDDASRRLLREWSGGVFFVPVFDRRERRWKRSRPPPQPRRGRRCCVRWRRPRSSSCGSGSPTWWVG